VKAQANFRTPSAGDINMECGGCRRLANSNAPT
jgi:hypothetical protein